MYKRDLQIGTTVYHSTCWNWGKGTVTERRLTDNLGLPTSQQFLVSWEDRLDGPTWCRARELCKTPKPTPSWMLNLITMRKTQKQQTN